jgi:hypothetical protein
MRKMNDDDDNDDNESSERLIVETATTIDYIYITKKVSSVCVCVWGGGGPPELIRKQRWQPEILVIVLG